MILGDKVAEFRGSDGKLTGAVTDAGREIEAELAIVGVGVQPSTGYLEGSGIALERGTVIVDERFATNVPGIWAVGDIANFHDPVFGHRRLIQHWTNANHQGERLGRLLAGRTRPTTRSRSSSPRSSARRSACSATSTAATTSSSCAARSRTDALIGCYLRDERLVAALIVGQPPEMQKELNALLRGRARLVDRGPLADADSPPGAAFDLD